MANTLTSFAVTAVTPFREGCSFTKNTDGHRSTLVSKLWKKTQHKTFRHSHRQNCRVSDWPHAPNSCAGVWRADSQKEYPLERLSFREPRKYIIWVVCKANYARSLSDLPRTSAENDFLAGISRNFRQLWPNSFPKSRKIPSQISFPSTARFKSAGS